MNEERNQVQLYWGVKESGERTYVVVVELCVELGVFDGRVGLGEDSLLRKRGEEKNDKCG